MGSKNEIISRFKEKLKILKKHDKSYYENDNPQINDSEYDEIKNEIFEYEKKYQFLKKLKLTKNIVGTPPSNKFKKINHLRPMLSLSNSFNEKGMEDFLKKVNNFLNDKNKKIELFSEPKIDGISATLIYKKGILTKGLSRGDGVTGEDILNNLKTITSIPKKINSNDVPERIEIRCEIYISKKDYIII